MIRNRPPYSRSPQSTFLPTWSVIARGVCLWLVVVIGSSAEDSRAADDAKGAGSAAPAATTTKAIEARIARVKESKEIEAERRDEITGVYQKAIEQLHAADEFAASVADWVKAVDSAPADIEKVNADLAGVAELAAAGMPSSAAAGNGDLARMQQALTRAEADRDRRRQEQTDLGDENDRRSARRQEIAARDEELDGELRDVQEGLDRDRDENDLLAEAQQSLLGARRAALIGEREAHRQELLAYEATDDLIAARRDLAATRLQSAEDLLDAWQKAVNDIRRSEADRVHAEAVRRLEAARPALRGFAETNVGLAAGRKELAGRIEETVAESETATARLDELREQFEQVTERARRLGFTDAVGLLLRNHRDSLAVVDESLRHRRARAASVSQMSVALTDYEEQRARLADLNSRVRMEMARLRGIISESEIAAATIELRELLETQKKCLSSLIRDTTRYVEEMMELESVERQLIASVREFAAFSDKHILWIRSAGLPQPADGARLAAAAKWLVKPAHWEKACRALSNDARVHRTSYATFGLLLAGLAIGPWWLRRSLNGRSRHDPAGGVAPIAWTAGMLAAHAIAAARWPAVFSFLGFRLAGAVQADAFVAALGRSLTNIALPWFLAASLVRVVRYRGVAALFGWTAAQAAHYRRVIHLAATCAIPLVLVLFLAEAQYSEGPRNTIGRLAFVLLMLIGAEAARRLGRGAASLRPETPAAFSWSARRMTVIRFVTIGAPLALVAASIAGYHYTALQLARRALETVGFVGLVLVLQAAGARWARRGVRKTLSDASLSVMESLALREIRGTESEPAAPVDVLAKPAAVSAQIQRLVRLAGVLALLGGLVMIWSEVFPVIRIVRSVGVWPLPVRFIDPEMAVEEAARIVTLAGLLAALGVTLLTFAAARNVRGVLELTLLRYVALDAGARYAVAAISRYLIAVAGLLTACSQVGIGASQLHWLVAAMTVGLGFGLQEIFANFVSGLILLFERPVRIGDIVSVEGTTGTVSRIRIRATTITDGDMRELIVPNKELITGRVINWTLSNTVARMTIAVRTAHGVDPDKARNLLLAVAVQHPLVLKQPPPQALFDEFSDKTQNFTLRVFMANCDVYAQLRHELLTGIQRTFRQAGISLNSSDAASLPVPVLPQEQKAA